MQVEDQDFCRIAARLGSTPTDIADSFFQQDLGRRGDKHAFGLLGSKLAATTGSAGLIQQRRALGRGFAQVNTRHLEVFADMADLMNLARVAEYPPLAIAQDCPLLPAAFPQLVANLQVLLGIVVARIVLGQCLLADVPGAAFQIGGDYVPAGTALGQVVEGRQAAGEGIRVLE